MLRVLVGDGEKDYQLIVDCVEGGPLQDWVVPKDAVPGDEAVMFVPGHGFLARATVSTVPTPTLFGNQHAYRSQLSQVSCLPVPVPLEYVEQRLPTWGWLRQRVKSRHTPDTEVARRLAEALTEYQRLHGRAGATTVDRTDPIAAEKILTELCPDANALLCWARHAWQAIEVARSIAAESWEVTLFSDGVRLNVGQVAVLELWSGIAVFYCCAPVQIEPSEQVRPQDDWGGYGAVKGGTERWIVAVTALPGLQPRLIEKHIELVRLAARSKKASPFRAAQSPGVVLYLEKVVGGAGRDGECVFPDEVLPGNLREGAKRTVEVNAYERNPEARRRCIQHYGPSCAVCGLEFGMAYGPVADGHIHVHHLKPVAEIGAEYEVDPVADLRPVCPNCHAVIHIGGQTRSIEEVRRLLETSGNKRLPPRASRTTVRGRR